MRVHCIAIAAAMFVASGAHAQWETVVEDDIFSKGKKATMVGPINRASFFVADCTSDGELYFGYAEKGETEDNDNILVIYIRADDREVIDGYARMAQRNSEFLEIGSSDRLLVMPILEEIEAARRVITVGIENEATGAKVSNSGSAAGSTAAVRRFIAACDLR